MGKVVLLTGAPATGKSTLCKRLLEMIPGLKSFDYGQLLLDEQAQKGVTLSYPELRAKSSETINPSDVGDLDEKLILRIGEVRGASDVVIDSHAVTRETYGFRAVPFSFSQLQRLRLDAILFLRCDPQVVVKRIADAPAGRQAVSEELAREHQFLQESLSLSYAMACGCPINFLETSNSSLDSVAQSALMLLAKLGIAGH